MVPTLDWTNEREKNEFKYKLEHVRRAQWKGFYENKDSKDEEQIQTSEKQNIPKLLLLSLPLQAEIGKAIKTYTLQV